MDQQNENTEFLEKYKEHWDKFFEEWSKGESHQKNCLKMIKFGVTRTVKGKCGKQKTVKKKAHYLNTMFYHSHI